MTLYAVFVSRWHADRLPVLVPDRFAPSAMLVPPIHLLGHGLWLEALGWVVVTSAIAASAIVLGSGAALLLYALFNLWLGFAASDLRRAALRRHGWLYRGERVAADPDMALLEAMR